MQIFVEWNNYKIQAETVFASNLMVKTGIVTFLSVSVASSNVILDSYYPMNQRNENFYLLKDFISCLIVFVLIPFTMILRSKAIVKHCKKVISSNPIFILLLKTIVVTKGKFLTIRLFMRNTVYPAGPLQFLQQ
jgi:hypothetical protein